MAATLKPFLHWLTTPLGLAITVYALNIVAWGGMLFLLLINAAPAMCVPSCTDANSPRRRWIEIDAQILNALFCVTGFGLAPWRLRDLFWWAVWRCRLAVPPCCRAGRRAAGSACCGLRWFKGGSGDGSDSGCWWTGSSSGSSDVFDSGDSFNGDSGSGNGDNGVSGDSGSGMDDDGDGGGIGDAGGNEGLLRLAHIHRSWFRLPPWPPLSREPSAAQDDDTTAAGLESKAEPAAPAATARRARAPPTPRWKLDWVIWTALLNTMLQCALAGIMWGLNRFTRPSWATGLLVVLACAAGAASGGMIFFEQRRVKTVEQGQDALAAAAAAAEAEAREGLGEEVKGAV